MADDFGFSVSEIERENPVGYALLASARKAIELLPEDSSDFEQTLAGHDAYAAAGIAELERRIMVLEETVRVLLARP